MGIFYFTKVVQISHICCRYRMLYNGCDAYILRWRHTAHSECKEIAIKSSKTTEHQISLKMLNIAYNGGFRLLLKPK